MAHKGHSGTSMGAVEVSPRKRNQIAQRKRAQAKRWAAKSGPVVTYKVGEPRPELPPPK